MKKRKKSLENIDIKMENVLEIKYKKKTWCKRNRSNGFRKVIKSQYCYQISMRLYSKI